MIKLYNDDCLNTLNELPEKSVDFILCDLPYGVTQNKKDIRVPFEEMWKGIWRVAKDNCCVALFCQGKFFIELANSQIKYYRYDLVWNKVEKTGFLNANRCPLRQTKRIAVFYKKQPTYNPQLVVGTPSHSRGNKRLFHEYKNNNYGKFKFNNDEPTNLKYPSDLLSYEKPHPSICVHPTQKPVELCEWLVKTYSNENEVVLDFTMGGGTTGVACLRTNRNFIGVEKDKQYFEIAKRRIEDEELKLV